MAMYAIGILPLIQSLSNESAKQVWYADDSAACGDLTHLRSRWDRLAEIGPKYGYQQNALKMCLIVKEDKSDDAIATFQGTGVNITLEGKTHLGAALGTRSFVTSHIQKAISGWVREVEQLSSFAFSQPHAAYSAFTHGLTSMWTYLARTTPDIGNLLKPLEEAIRHKFLTAVTDQSAPNDTERYLLALSAHLGGLGITDPSQLTTFHHTTSVEVSPPLVSLILQHAQSTTYPANCRESQKRAKSTTCSAKRQHETACANDVFSKLPGSQQRALLASKEKGASSWLSALPMVEHGFALAFRDALCLRYGW